MRSIIKQILQFYERKIFFYRKVILEKKVSKRHALISPYTRICENTQFNNSNLGRYSYVGPGSILNNTKIGSFTSIGPDVKVIYGTHPLDLVSTSPIFYSSRGQIGKSFVKENAIEEFRRVSGTNKSVCIGNDVWIGFGARIVEGVNIGDGSVVLAGAYVTKDVEPYSIVGGIPAKCIRKRFAEDICKHIFESNWWTWDIEKIERNKDLFLNVDQFVELIKR